LLILSSPLLVNEWKLLAAAAASDRLPARGRIRYIGRSTKRTEGVVMSAATTKSSRIAAVATALLAALLSVALPAAGANAASSKIADVFPYCAWPIESTPALANEAGPDPNATYWTTPFKHSSDYTSITIKGVYPTARFASFTVYNNGGADFTETVNGKAIPSQVSDYVIKPDLGSLNPWQVTTVPAGRSKKFTIRIRRNVTAAGQAKLNEIPMVDTSPVLQTPIAPSDIGFVTFRTYIPSGGNTKVKLPTMTINRRVTPTGITGAHSAAAKYESTVLPTCNATRIARAVKVSNVLKKVINKAQGNPDTTAVVTPCTVNGVDRYTNGCPPPLTWHQSSSEQTGALFPNTANAYIANWFQPAAGTVVLTRGLMPVTPKTAGSGQLGNSIGATPVNWTQSPLPYQLRYWSVNNYPVKEPYPVVTTGTGKNKTYGGVADYQTATDSNGYYTVVSSLPNDKPSASSLASNSATWIAMQGDEPNVAETQWMRNMMGEFQYAVQSVPAPALATDYVPAATVEQAMGPYYPRSAQCTVAVFEAQGVDGCFAASAAG
jgi:hypothetical protein